MINLEKRKEELKRNIKYKLKENGYLYNLLDYVNIGSPLEYEDATVVSQILIDIDGKGEFNHWITSAINFLNGVILHVKYVNPNASLIDVIRFILLPSKQINNNLADILCIPRDNENNDLFYGKNGYKYNPMPDGRLMKENLKPFNHLQNFENKNLLKEIYGKEAYGTLHPIIKEKFEKFFYLCYEEQNTIISTIYNLINHYITIKDSDLII